MRKIQIQIQIHMRNSNHMRNSGEPFCSEAKFGDEKVLTQLAGVAPDERDCNVENFWPG